MCFWLSTAEKAQLSLNYQYAFSSVLLQELYRGGTAHPIFQRVHSMVDSFVSLSMKPKLRKL